MTPPRVWFTPAVFSLSLERFSLHFFFLLDLLSSVSSRPWTSSSISRQSPPASEGICSRPSEQWNILSRTWTQSWLDPVQQLAEAGVVPVQLLANVNCMITKLCTPGFYSLVIKMFSFMTLSGLPIHISAWGDLSPHWGTCGSVLQNIAPTSQLSPTASSYPT